jgi:NADH dehydrogenase [ubiquinone] 1 alpha subcomplex assembly factor 1
MIRILPKPLALGVLAPSLLAIVIVVSGWAPAQRPAPREAPMQPSEPQQVVFSFDRADEAQWMVVNDGVMGGGSAGFVAVEEGTLRFTGTLVTRGGGFTSVRTRRVLDLTGQTGLELRVRGNGRPFEIELDDGRTSGWRSVSHRAPFMTSADWTVVRVPFRAFRSSVFGQAVNAPPVNLAGIQSVGIYILDGRDGPFQLEVDFIRTYRATEDRP